MPNRPEDWIVPEWPVPERVRALITSRNGGSGTGPYASMNLGLYAGDYPDAVEANRRLLKRLLPAEPRWLDQVHGTTVVDAETVTHPVQADASFTKNPNCVSVVMIADCLPILFADRAGSAVAAAHAGWRGLAGGVIENTVRALDAPRSGPRHSKSAMRCAMHLLQPTRQRASHFAPISRANGSPTCLRLHGSGSPDPAC